MYVISIYVIMDEVWESYFYWSYWLSIINLTVIVMCLFINILVFILVFFNLLEKFFGVRNFF